MVSCILSALECERVKLILFLNSATTLFVLDPNSILSAASVEIAYAI